MDGPNMPNLGNHNEKVYRPSRSSDDLPLVRKAADGLVVEVAQFASNHEGRASSSSIAPPPRPMATSSTRLTQPHTARRQGTRSTTPPKPVMEVDFANTARHFADVAPHWRQQTSRFTYTETGLVMGLRQYSYLGAPRPHVRTRRRVLPRRLPSPPDLLARWKGQ
ncbi:hypothetical protein ACFVZT_33140 [Streptomyces sp. NPDC058321]|uniref:hypothetical protein n=1 Tax=Streptomyces sp. NPDC058321 TaxID=3346445 RepID=UPI0036DFDE48